MKMNWKRQNLLQFLNKNGFVVFAILFFLGMAYQYLYVDLLRDEATSFMRCSLHPFWTTMTNYFAPNNHILFNLFQNAVSKILGFSDLAEAIDYLPFYRSLQIGASLFTLYFTYQFANHFFNKQTAQISVLLVVSCIPFINYVVQLRGYNFSMLMGMMMVYSSYRYIQTQQQKYFWGTTFSSFAILYIIPSNIYLVLPLGLLWLFKYGKTIIDTRKVYFSEEQKRLFGLLIAFGIAAFLVALVYAPIYERVLFNRYVTREPAHRFYVLLEYLPHVTNGFISSRHALLLLVVPGLYYCFNKENQKNSWGVWQQLLGIYLAGFVISFLRNDLPFYRTFSVMIPIFSIVLAVPIASFIDKIIRSDQERNYWMMGIYVYCMFAAINFYVKTIEEVDQQILQEKKVVNTTHSYFFSNLYQPDEAAIELKKRYEKNPYPVLLVPNELEHIISGQYLRKLDIPSYLLRWINENKNLKTKMKNPRLAHITHSSKSYQTYDKTLRYPIHPKNYHPSFMQFEVMLEFLNKKVPSDHYYLLSSYEKRLQKKFYQFLDKKYTLKKLSKGNSAYNLYLLSRKKKMASTTENLENKPS